MSEPASAPAVRAAPSDARVGPSASLIPPSNTDRHDPAVRTRHVTGASAHAMNETEFPLWGPGFHIRLAELVEVVPDNDWQWSVLECIGIGTMPWEMRSGRVNELVLASQVGFLMSWRELKEFADGLESVEELLVVAAASRDLLIPEQLSVDDFSGCLMMLEAFDNTTWTVAGRSGLFDDIDVVDLLRARYGGS